MTCIFDFLCVQRPARTAKLSSHIHQLVSKGRQRKRLGRSTLCHFHRSKPHRITNIRFLYMYFILYRVFAALRSYNYRYLLDFHLESWLYVTGKILNHHRNLLRESKYYLKHNLIIRGKNRMKNLSFSFSYLP